MKKETGTVLLSVICVSCGPQGETVALNADSLDKPNAQKDESIQLGLSNTPAPVLNPAAAPQLRERLEGIDPLISRAFVSFVSPADPNRICRGALGYEVPWLTLDSGWGSKRKNNYFWNKTQNVDIFLYTDRRCLMDKNGNYPKQKVNLAARIYRSGSPERQSLELINSKISYDPIFLHALDKNNSTTVARLWQFRITKPSSSSSQPSEINELPNYIHPVCPMKQGYGNINYTIPKQHFEKSTDATGVEMSAAALFFLRPFSGQATNSYSAGASEFIKNESGPDIVRLRDQSNSSRKIIPEETGMPVFFQSTSSKAPKPTCLNGILSYPDNSGQNIQASAFPEIHELRNNWFTIEKVSIPATSKTPASVDYKYVVFSNDLNALPKTDSRLNLKFADLSISENVFGKRGPMAELKVTPPPILQNCSNDADAAEINNLQKRLRPLSELLLVTEKRNCDKLEIDDNARCEAESQAAGTGAGAVMMCKAPQEWGGRVGCYIDKNKQRSPELKRLKGLMKPFIDNGCEPSEGRQTYDAPSEIDLNAPNTAGQ